MKMGIKKEEYGKMETLLKSCKKVENIILLIPNKKYKFKILYFIIEDIVSSIIF